MDPDDTSLEAAVERHLVESGFPADGGINEKWVAVGVGPIPLCFPNTKARRKATPIHDLNHVVSGYDHDAVGEAEIGAWELGGGCKNYWAAWVLNWAALVPGIATRPGRVLKAFARGRRTGNLYAADLESVRVQPVDQVRKTLCLNEDYPVRTSDVLLFAGFAALAPLVASVPALASVVTSPLWLAAGAHKRRHSVETAEDRS